MVYVIGEALIDLVLDPTAADASGAPGYLAHPGGSPFNVAIGLSRLGDDSVLLARLSADAFGRQLRARAGANGVDLSLAVAATESSTLAVVSLDADRNATYDFYRTGTADWQWTAAELNVIPPDADWIHTGSIASWTDPGASEIERLLLARPDSIISYDPNIRPLLLSDHDAAVARVERLIALSTVVKASGEDLEWLYPGHGFDEVLRRWRQLGPRVVVVTDGGNGARALFGDGEPFAVGAKPITVVDTVGAGDAFMAGLIHALHRDGLDAVSAAVDEAILVAALTCSRSGANPPTAEELAAAR